MSLSELFIKNIKVEKRKMFHDERNLYLEANDNGTKVWKYRYWENGKEHEISIGKYPTISLKEARVKRDDLAMRQEKGLPISSPETNLIITPPTFQEIAMKWYATRIEPVQTTRHSETVISRLKRLLFPKIGNRPISKISAPEMLQILVALQDAGIVETMHRTKQIAGQVFRFAIALGVCERDPAVELRGALTPNFSK